MTPLQKLPKNVGDLGKLFVAKGFKKLPKVQYIAQSGHTGSINLATVVPCIRCNHRDRNLANLSLIDLAQLNSANSFRRWGWQQQPERSLVEKIEEKEGEDI